MIGEHVYLVNREDRTDRLAHSIYQLSKMNIGFERFNAINGDTVPLDFVERDIPGWTKGAVALSYTTSAILEDAIEKGYESILIFEDDVLFGENQSDFDDAKLYLSNMTYPPKIAWDFFHYGKMDVWKPESYNDKVVQLKRSYCCHAYSIQARAYKPYLEQLKLRDRPIDWVTADMQIKGRSYATKETIAYQLPNYSDIRKENVNYKLV
jgi:GR25 family glycosyltransferase involved in LPS biosynthesis